MKLCEDQAAGMQSPVCFPHQNECRLHKSAGKHLEGPAVAEVRALSFMLQPREVAQTECRDNLPP